MLVIDEVGRVINARVRLALCPAIERGNLPCIHGIVVHQTGSATAASTMSGYKVPGSNGAHLLIDKDGAIFQTASLHKKTQHVGHVKSRCIAEKRCSPADLSALRGKRVGAGIGAVERAKSYPDRYPLNGDSIGIEIVSLAPGNVVEPVTDAQQVSLGWLLNELLHTLRLSRADVFRHSEVSWKQQGEAVSARW